MASTPPSISSFNTFFQYRSSATITGNIDTLIALVTPLCASFSKCPPGSIRFQVGHKRFIQAVKEIVQRARNDFQQPSEEIQKVAGYDQILNLRYFIQQNNHRLEAMEALLQALTADLEDPAFMNCSDGECIQLSLADSDGSRYYVSGKVELLSQAIVHAGFILVTLGHKIQYQGKVLTTSYVNKFLRELEALFDSFDQSLSLLIQVVGPTLLFWSLAEDFHSAEGLIRDAYSYLAILKQNFENIQSGVSLEAMDWISINLGSHLM